MTSFQDEMMVPSTAVLLLWMVYWSKVRLQIQSWFCGFYSTSDFVLETVFLLFYIL